MARASGYFAVITIILLQPGYADGCSRSSGANKGTLVYVQQNTTVPIPVNHRHACSENETHQTACINGGSCFAVDIGHRSIQCACPERYIGVHCEMINPELIFKQTEEKKVRTAVVTGTLSFLGVVAIVVIAICIYIFIIRKKTNLCKISKNKKPKDEYIDQNKEEEKEPITI